jgi:hypothetical protein
MIGSQGGGLKNGLPKALNVVENRKAELENLFSLSPPELTLSDPWKPDNF